MTAWLLGLTLSIGAISGVANVDKNVIDLSGTWRFQTDAADFERAFENSGAHRDLVADTIQLPGTTDTNRKGIKTTSRPINRLSRLYEYVGPAWYQKEVVIPETWEGKFVELFLERSLWITSIYVDGNWVGSVKSFSTPHTYDLSSSLTPGKHLISICADNRVPDSFGRWSHAFSEYTQTAWNGLVGKLELRAKPIVHISDLQAYPKLINNSTEVVCQVANPDGTPVSGTLRIEATSSEHKVPPIEVPFSGSDTVIKIRANLPMGKDVQLWDEFHPSLYKLSAKLKSSGQTDEKTLSYGMREYRQTGAHFAVNGRPTFLRGTLECAIFPLTGHPDMTLEGWVRICKIVKSYGLNHIRFHSWCPPEAAFAAADQVGVYLHVELPCWTEVGKDPALDAFLKDEMDRILSSYGNHPSFVQLCMGNELSGNFDVLADLVRHGQKVDPRHLYSGSTARKHLPEDEFYVSHQSPTGGITTYGARGPQTDYDLRAAYASLKGPGVAHEVGQRAVYPNFDEMAKYKGVLYPRNFEVFKETLAKQGMLDQAKDFFNVSGRMTAMLYKESIEALLRTPNCGGFQLLDLHDFPGQGTALVGILDPFWDSKGLISPEQFREFCSPTVPLLRLPKRTYTNDETLVAEVDLYHYGEQPLKEKPCTWVIRAQQGDLVASGSLASVSAEPGSLTSLGKIQVQLAKVKTPQKLMVEIAVGAGIRNRWEVWVYPKQLPRIEQNSFVEAKTVEEALAALKAGKSVLLTPNVNLIEGKRAEFQNHFWCPTMFRWDPMTMGTLIQEKHPALKEFPTEFFTNWQWWDIISNARLLQLDGMPKDLRPIVQPIDTYDRCLRLGIVLEAKVGNSRLLMSSADLTSNLDQRPTARQLLYSLRRYVAGDSFNPKANLSPEQVASWFRKPSLTTGAKVVMADSYEVGNEPQNAIDDDVNTLWHTSYSSPGNFAVTNKQPESDYPHEIQIELVKDTAFRGFVYVPRRDGVNGYIAQYEFYVSKDGKNWGEPIAKGAFARDARQKIVLFGKTVTARYIRLVALKGFAGQKWASIAELKLVP